MARRRKPLTSKTVDALYAWIVTVPDDGEGICSISVGGVRMALMGSDIERIKGYRRQAETNNIGYSVRLIKFSQREEVEVEVL